MEIRNIIFRAKRKDNGEWVYGDLIHKKTCNINCLIIRNQNVEFYDHVEYEVIPETVGQYTGLTDKNGAKIFEGDIVKQGFNEYKILWYSDLSKFGFFTAKNHKQCGFNKFAMDMYEVIGNVHDNPELLEVDENV